MKFVLLFNIIFAYDDSSTGYLCNRCDVYDTNSNALLEKSLFRGPRPKLNSNSSINVNVTCNDGDIYNYNRRAQKSLFFSMADKTTLIFAAASSIIGLINLVATATLILTERKINASARKTYMQTAILENE